MDSYYQCLAKRFQESDFSREDFGTSCCFGQICSPFSLPPVDKNIKLCENDTQRRFYDKKIVGLKADQDKHCLKSCKVFEYQIFIEKLTKKHFMCKQYQNLTTTFSPPSSFQRNFPRSVSTRKFVSNKISRDI